MKQSYRMLILLFTIVTSASQAGTLESPLPFEVITGKCRLLWAVTGDATFTGMGGVTAVHDANHDGVNDVIVTGRVPGSGVTAFRLLSGRDGATLKSYTVPAGPYIVGTGDFNRDHRTDLVLQAYISKPVVDPPTPSSGPGYYRIFVVDSETGRQLWSRTSPKSQPDFGASVSVSADLNGDRIAEVLVVSMTRDANGTATPFTVVLNGRDGTTLGRIPAPAGASSFFGAGMATALLDDDSIPDYVFSDILFAPEPTRIEARAWAISGATGSALWTRREVSDTLFGDTIVATSDLNGDGIPDLLFAAPNDRDFVRGTVQAVDGRTGRKIWIAPGRMMSGQFGRSLITVPDLTGDGVPEVAAGAPAMLPPMLVGGVPGHFQVLNGRTGKVLALVKEILPSGMSFSSQFGMNLAAPGDLNGDGNSDLVVSAPRFGGSETGGMVPGFVGAFSVK